MNYEPRQSQDNVLKIQNAMMATVIHATIMLSRNANTMSPEKKSRTEMRRRAGSGSTSFEM